MLGTVWCVELFFTGVAFPVPNQLSRVVTEWNIIRKCAEF